MNYKDFKLMQYMGLFFTPDWACRIRFKTFPVWPPINQLYTATSNKS